MKLNTERTSDCRVQKARMSKSEFDSCRISTVDVEIGKRAYWNLGLKRGEGVTEIGRSADLFTTMVSLERMLEQLKWEPATDLLDINKANDGNFSPLKSSEKRYKEIFILSLPGFVRAIRDLPVECKFSVAVEVFIKCCRDYSIDDCIQSFGDRQLRDRTASRLQKERINDFYWKLKENLCSPAVRKKICDQKWKVEINFRRFSFYVDSLFKVNARLVVIRIDLEYGENSKPSLDQATGDLDRLFSNKRHNDKIFHALVGFIVKLEFGIYNGYHFHVLLFFDGSKRANYSDSHLAEEIGEYWRSVITKGRGRYWNLNDKKSSYVKNGCLGIGAIHANDSGKIENLKNIVRYFCKKDQFFKPLSKSKLKTIRKGRFPLLRSKKLGRPRNKAT